MPLSLAKPGERAAVNRVGGGDGLKKRLETLGFTAGTEVQVLSRLADSLIVMVKDSRIALSGELARRIMVCICEP
ncbi:MAG: ferrous iron transport protein A [Treponema sp.]|jgi:ferrous iron transport protein A|nr:ferrous iron transport protein A [Treponema sp.]